MASGIKDRVKSNTLDITRTGKIPNGNKAMPKKIAIVTISSIVCLLRNNWFDNTSTNMVNVAQERTTPARLNRISFFGFIPEKKTNTKTKSA